MPTEPASNLGAIRKRLEHRIQGSCWAVCEPEVCAILAAYDAQAARLAAMQPVADAALAWRGARGHPFEAEATAQLVAVVEAYRDTGAGHDDGR